MYVQLGLAPRLPPALNDKAGALKHGAPAQGGVAVAGEAYGPAPGARGGADPALRREEPTARVRLHPTRAYGETLARHVARGGLALTHGLFVLGAGERAPHHLHARHGFRHNLANPGALARNARHRHARPYAPWRGAPGDRARCPSTHLGRTKWPRPCRGDPAPLARVFGGQALPPSHAEAEHPAPRQRTTT